MYINLSPIPSGFELVDVVWTQIQGPLLSCEGTRLFIRRIQRERERERREKRDVFILFFGN